MRGGVLRVPRLGVVVTDAVLIREVLKDYRSTSLLGEGGVGHLWTQVLGDWVVDSFDGPGHVDLRRRSRDLFTEANAAGIVGPVFAGPVGRAVRLLEDGGVLDVAALARELVGRMVVALLGLRLPGLADDDTDPRPYLEVYAAGERLASLAVGTQASTHLSSETVARARTLVDELTRDVPQAFRESGSDTLLGRCREMGLSERESTGLATLLLVAGTETAASAMGRTVALLADTGQVADVVADPSLVPDAVREGLRVSTPAPVIGRNVVRDTTIGRLPVRARRARRAAHLRRRQRHRPVRRAPSVRPVDPAAVVRRRTPPVPGRTGRQGRDRPRGGRSRGHGTPVAGGAPRPRAPGADPDLRPAGRRPA